MEPLYGEAKRKRYNSIEGRWLSLGVGRQCGTHTPYVKSETMSQKNAARHNLRANPPILPRLPRPPVSIVLQPCTHSRCPKPQESSRVRNLRSLRSKAYGGVVRPTSRLLGDPHLLAQLLADRHARLGLGREPRALVFAHRLHAQHPIGHLAWVLSAVESIESAAPHGRTAASHRSLNVFAARPECVAQPGAWRASPKRPGYSMLWRCQDGALSTLPRSPRPS